MKNYRRTRTLVLISFLIVNALGTQGCGMAPLLAALKANPAITAAFIATIPAVATIWSNHSTNNDRLEVEKLQAETARINAITTNAETLSQQKIEQRKLELELIKEKKANANNPEVSQELEQLEADIEEDKRTVDQTLTTAQEEGEKLADDDASVLPSGSTSSGS